MKKAPILISVYDRLDSLKECISSLLKCPEAIDSVLYIASDAAHKPENECKVSTVRDYIRSIEGFKSVQLLDAQENLGSYYNLHSNVRKVLDLHENIIFIEDDNVVNVNFLSYMNRSLEEYKASVNIKFICSYLFPGCVPVTEQDVFLWRGFSPWGFATWRSVWDVIDFDTTSLYKNKPNFKEVMKLWFTDPNSVGVLKEDIKGEVIATDVRICFNLCLLSGYSVFPKECISVNRGHDGNGEHGSSNSIYLQQNLSAFNPLLPLFLQPSMKNQFYMFFHRLNLKSIYNLFVFLFLKKA